MNKALKEFTNYLKYEGIQVDDEDAGKILDMYMRIVIQLTQGVRPEFGLNVIFTGKANLDFSEYNEDTVRSLNDYVITTTDNFADHKLSADTTNSIIDKNNIITVLKAAHLFINTIIGLETEVLTRADHPALPTDSTSATFVSHNKDGTCLSITAYSLVNDNGEKEIVYDFISSCLINYIPDEVIYV